MSLFHPTHDEWRKKKAPLKQVISMQEVMRIDLLPQTIQDCYRWFEYALNSFTYLTDEPNNMIGLHRQSMKDAAWRFDDYLRQVVERRDFVSRADLLELLRHRRMLIELGILEKVTDDSRN